MNNMNFSRNPFDGANSQTKIAGNHVFKQGDGGRMSLDEVRENMHEAKHPGVEIPKKTVETPDAQLAATRARMQAFKNIGKQ